MGVGDSWGTREQLLHPRDSHGRFRNTWKMASGVVEKLLATLSSFNPKTFNSDEDAANYVHGQARSNRFLTNRGTAIDRFLRGYSTVNADLRAGKPNADAAAIEKGMSPLPDDLILSRVVGPEAFGLNPQSIGNVEELTGKLISDKGFSSTNLGTPMPHQPGQITMSIVAPKGTKALMPSTSRPTREVILGRDQPYRITKVDPDGQGGFYVYAVAQGDSNAEKPVDIGRAVPGDGVEAATPETPAAPAPAAPGAPAPVPAPGAPAAPAAAPVRTGRPGRPAGPPPAPRNEGHVGTVGTGQAPAAPGPGGVPGRAPEPAPSAPPAPDLPPAPEPGPDTRSTFRSAFEEAGLKVPSVGTRRKEFNDAYLGVASGKKTPQDAVRDLDDRIAIHKATIASDKEDGTDSGPLPEDVKRLQGLSDLIKEHYNFTGRKTPKAAPEKVPAAKKVAPEAPPKKAAAPAIKKAPATKAEPKEKAPAPKTAERERPKYLFGEENFKQAQKWEARRKEKESADDKVKDQQSEVLRKGVSGSFLQDEDAKNAPPIKLDELSAKDVRAKALKNYAGNTDEYQEQNNYLRSGDKGRKQIDNNVKKIDSLMGESELDKPIVVYRGLTSLEGIFGNDEDDVTGKTFTDKAFVSVSTNPRVATEFGKVHLRIKVPKGTRAVRLQEALIPGKKIKEDEILLDRGLEYRITKDQKLDGHRIIDVEVVPKGEAPTPAARKAAQRKESRDRLAGGAEERARQTAEEKATREATNKAREDAATKQRDAEIADIVNQVDSGPPENDLVKARIGISDSGFKSKRVSAADTAAGLRETAGRDYAKKDRDLLLKLADFYESKGRPRKAAPAKKAEPAAGDVDNMTVPQLRAEAARQGKKIPSSITKKADIQAFLKGDKEAPLSVAETKTIATGNNGNSVIGSRRTLDSLEAKGLIEFRDADRPSGKPAPYLTEKGRKAAGFSEKKAPEKTPETWESLGKPQGPSPVGVKIAHEGGTYERLPGEPRRYKVINSEGKDISGDVTTFPDRDQTAEDARTALRMDSFDKESAAKSKASGAVDAWDAIPGSWSYDNKKSKGFGNDKEIDDALTRWATHGGKGNSRSRAAEPAVNRALRGDVKTTPEIQADIDALDRALGQSKLSKDVNVHRGVSDGTHILPADWKNKDLKGVEWTQDGFLPVSGNKEAAEAYVGNEAERGFLMNLKLPKGSSAVAIRDNPGGVDDEGEIVLPRGMKFRVTKDNGVQNGLRSLDVEVVGSTKSEAATPDIDKMTIPQLREEAKRQGKRVPTGITKKADIQAFLKDNTENRKQSQAIREGVKATPADVKATAARSAAADQRLTEHMVAGKTNVSRMPVGKRVLLSKDPNGNWVPAKNKTGATPMSLVKRETVSVNGRQQNRLTFKDDNGNEITLHRNYPAIQTFWTEESRKASAPKVEAPKPAPKKVLPTAGAPKSHEEIATNIRSARTREEAEKVLNDANLTIPELRQLAESMDIATKGSKSQISKDIVYWGVGRKLDREAVSRPGAVTSRTLQDAMERRGDPALVPVESRKPLLANHWGTGSGEIEYHEDGNIGTALRLMGPEAQRYEVPGENGDNLYNVLGRLATKANRGQITQQQLIDKVKEIQAKMPDSAATRALSMAIRDMEVPDLPPIELPNGTPGPVTKLARTLEKIPVAHKDRVGRPGSNEVERLADLMTEWQQGRMTPLRFMAELRQRLLNNRHESEEGKSEIDRAVLAALQELEALMKTDRKKLLPPEMRK